MELRLLGRFHLSLQQIEPLLDRIADLIRELGRNLQVTVNVNNHYEGSAPKTIERLSLILNQ